MKSALYSLARLVAGFVAAFLLLGVMLLVGVVSSILLHFRGTAELPAECAVVFGAAVYGYSRPGPSIVRRVSAAATLYREGRVERLILTGGEGRGEGKSLSEALVMQREALGHGVRSSDIVLEGDSHSTLENIRYSKPLASSCSSVVGISDGFHLARIELLARQAGWPELSTYPTDIHPQPQSEFRSVVREVVGYTYYMLRFHEIFGTFWRYEEPSSEETEETQESEVSLPWQSSQSLPARMNRRSDGDSLVSLDSSLVVGIRLPRESVN